eukprot:scaffold9345_cov120-Cylindrotheca_fusiformis.AAC.15
MISNKAARKPIAADAALSTVHHPGVKGPLLMGTERTSGMRSRIETIGINGLEATDHVLIGGRERVKVMVDANEHS